jgi:carbamoyl-phosphate synthase small subunit
MRLVLADGFAVEGRSFGADCAVAGEVVFNTGMTGYVEALTDPSYKGQILVLTYPLQGNYGVPANGFESERVQIQGLVVSSHCEAPSHHALIRTLGAWLRDSGVPAIAGVDTRSITRHLRALGTMTGTLGEGAIDHVVDMTAVAASVIDNEVVRYGSGSTRILAIDTGSKQSIFEALAARDATVMRVPFTHDWERLVDEVDGIVLTNGPGDPADLPQLVEQLRGVLARDVPVFGICLGHQLLALAAGARTYKLKYGHRSHNQPVMELATRRAYVTSQNHGYAVDTSTLPRDFEPWFVNLNDGTNEGLRHRYRPICSVQFHPEAAAGPNDTKFLFDEFLRMVGSSRKARRS